MPRRAEWQDSYFSNVNTYTLTLGGRPVRIRLASEREAQGVGGADLRRLGTIVQRLWQAGLLKFDGPRLALSLSHDGRIHREMYAILPTGEPGVYGVTSGSQKVALLFTDTRKQVRPMTGTDRRGRDPERERKRRLEALLAAESES